MCFYRKFDLRCQFIHILRHLVKRLAENLRNFQRKISHTGNGIFVLFLLFHLLTDPDSHAISVNMAYRQRGVLSFFSYHIVKYFLTLIPGKSVPLLLRFGTIIITFHSAGQRIARNRIYCHERHCSHRFCHRHCRFDPAHFFLNCMIIVRIRICFLYYRNCQIQRIRLLQQIFRQITVYLLTDFSFTEQYIGISSSDKQNLHLYLILR